MLRKLQDFSDFTLRAKDGEIGKVSTFFFDDVQWRIRYLVVKTGSWLQSQKELIAPVALQTPDWEQQQIPVNLTREQVKKSPDIDVDKPISRQMEVNLHTHYEWPGYVSPTVPPLPPPTHLRKKEQEEQEEEYDPHLRSAAEVIQYHIHAIDGRIGHVEDFLIDDEIWNIRYILVNTRDWLPGKTVLIDPTWIQTIEWAERKVTVGLTQEAIKTSPEFDPDNPLDRMYEEKLYSHYGRTKYWES